MPQIAGPDKKEFFDYLSEQGIEYKTKSVPVGELKGTQADFNAEKVDKMLEQMKESGVRPGSAVLASNDGYILDGHHRWRAQWKHDKSEEEKDDEAAAKKQGVLFGERQKEMFAKIFDGRFPIQYQKRDEQGRFAPELSALEKARKHVNNGKVVENSKFVSRPADKPKKKKSGSWSKGRLEVYRSIWRY